MTIIAHLPRPHARAVRRLGWTVLLLLGVSGTGAPAAAADPEPQASSAASPHGHSAAAFERMASDLKRSLDAKPQDVDNWILLGRTLASLNRWGEAKDAFNHAIALQPAEPALHAQLGEVLTLEASGSVTAAAREQFSKAPDDPRSRYYLAVGLAQSGDTEKAIRQLRALAAEAPPEAPWRQLVLDELSTLHGDGLPDAAPQQSLTSELQNELAALTTPAAPQASPATATPPETPAPAPAPAAAAAAPSLPASTAALEKRVQEQPGEAQGWLALARAYRAAGNEAKARDTLLRANQAVPANRDLLMAYADELADGIKPDSLPDNFIGVMRQINAIDPDQVDALWYLGLAAAQRGDSHRAASYWRRLATDLPVGSKDRKTVQERLDALP